MFVRAADDRAEAAQLRVRAVVADVDHGAVLDVAARTDANEIDVAAGHGLRPHRHVVAQFHVADHAGVGIDVHARAKRRKDVAVGTNIVHPAIVVGWVRIVLPWTCPTPPPPNCAPPSTACAPAGSGIAPTRASAWTLSPACATPSRPAARRCPPRSAPNSATAPRPRPCPPTRGRERVV